MRREELGIGYLFDHLLDALILVDANGGVVSWNRAAAAIFGYPEAEALNQRADLLMPAYDALLQAAGAAVGADGASVPPRAATETRGVRRDGAEFVAEVSVAQVPGTDGRSAFVAILVRDVTERHQREAQQQQASRLETLGLLASGVAHDFNNQLQAILGFSELLLHRLDPSDPGHAFVQEIIRAGQRGAALTRHLLAFGSRQPLTPERLDLNAVVGELERTLQTFLGPRIDLVLTLASTPVVIEGDRTHLEQVLLNLAANARDAMPDGGQLEIQTASVGLDADGARRLAPMSAGRYGLLSVRDTGQGMDRETQARIFEPFFTTKPHGKGTGLGLASVYGIVKQGRGYIWVDSVPNLGTTFSLYFGLEEGNPSLPSAPGDAKTPAVDPRRTVLVVDDEPPVLAVSQMVLETAGYAVIQAERGDEAVRLAEQYGESIDLLVVDMQLPGISGADVVARLRAQRPNLPVLFISGYAEDMFEPDRAREGAAFLQKPFAPGRLLEKISELLPSPSRPAD